MSESLEQPNEGPKIANNAVNLTPGSSVWITWEKTRDILRAKMKECVYCRQVESECKGGPFADLPSHRFEASDLSPFAKSEPKEVKCRLCTKLKSDHFELYASWKYCDDPTDKDLWYKNACRKFEQSQEPLSPAEMSEPKEVITDETVIAEVCSSECMPERNYHLNEIGVVVKNLYPKYRAILLEAEANTKKAKARDEKG